MKKTILIIALTLYSVANFAQLSSLVTAKGNEALGKYINFIIVDTKTQYVLAKNPVKYDPSKDMPKCYFTTVLGTQTGLTTGGELRNIVINTCFGDDKECWSVAENKETKQTMFSRRDFMGNLKAQYCWVPQIEGNYVIFLNLLGAASNNSNWGGYLTVNADGSLKSVKKMDEASRFEIIYED